MGRGWRMAVLAGLFALVTACGGGGGGGDGVASVSDGNAPADEAKKEKKDPAEAARDFAKCMRENGVDMPDPQPGDEGAVVIGGGASKGDDAFSKAHEKCKEHLPNGGEPEPPTPEELDRLRDEAKCLREQGLDVPDPTMEEPYITFHTGDKDAAKIDAAMEKCSDKKVAPAEGPTK